MVNFMASNFHGDIMNNYKYAFIDANFILKRNAAAMFKGNPIPEEDLTRSFYQSISRIDKELGKVIGTEHGFETGILLFDRYPYRKSSVFPAYKGDRVYYTKDYIKEHFDELLDSGRLVQVSNEAEHNERVMHVKYNIIWHPIDNYRTLGIKGFEADDLAYLLSRVVIDKPYKSILISIDNDWNTFVNDNVDFITPPGRYPMDRREGKINANKLVSEEYGIPTYDLGILDELYTKSHNNIDTYKSLHSEINHRDFCEAMYNEHDTIPDYETYYKYYSSMKMDQYLDEFKSLSDFNKLDII